MQRIVVGISGASGIVLGHHAVKALLTLGHSVELIISKAALVTAQHELSPEMASLKGFADSFNEGLRARLTVHRIGDIGARVASGTCCVHGMLVIPCSMATLAGISLGISDNLLRRAADVTLKERRRLVLVPRETPLNEIHLKHMLKISKMGGIIVPPVPSWYIRPKTMQDVELFIVGRALDALGISHELYPRWNPV